MYIAGVDEAGRGPWAGPVVAAAVILDPSQPIAGLNASKALSAKKRALLFERIKEDVLAYAVSVIEAKEIDQINILQATFKAMVNAVGALALRPDEVWVDGSMSPNFEAPSRTFVGGDAQYDCIAAASIVAKVTRDRIMDEYDEQYMGYGFAKHKGYGTAAHRVALEKQGPCAIHRLSYKPVRARLSCRVHATSTEL